MPTVQPPPPPPPTTAVPASPGAVAVVVKPDAALRQTLAQMRPGQALQARQASPVRLPAIDPTLALPVTSRMQTSAQTQVQTQFGPLTLQTAVPIPQGAQLTLVLTQLTPQPQFLITTLNGKPVAATLDPSARPQNAAGQASRASTAAPLTTGTRLTWTVLRPGPATPVPNTPASGLSPASPASLGTPPGPLATALPPAPGAPPGATLNPAPGAGQAPVSAPLVTPGSSAPVQSALSATPAPPPSPAPMPGTRFNISVVRITAANGAVNVTTPTANAPSGGGLIAGATLSGLVSGTTPQGQAIVQTPYGVFALDSRAPIPDGTRLVLKLESGPSLPNIPESARLGRAGPGETLSQSKSWAQLDEALKALAQADPARFENFTQNTLPRPGGKLTTQMLFFLSALKGGDVRAWLGDTTSRVIERERPGTLSKLGRDFTALSKLKDEPQSGDWRQALIPLWSGTELEQLRMYYRAPDPQTEAENGDDGTRFVLDLTLTNLGHVQLDGLMKAKSRRLDLIVRTDLQLPETWRTDLAEIFTTAQDITGIGGSLAFQGAPGNFIEFPAETGPSPHPGLLV